jgi:hypothetical protein
VLRSPLLARRTENRQEQEEDFQRQRGQGSLLLKERVGQKYGRVKVRAEVELLPRSERCPRRPVSELLLLSVQDGQK